MDEEGRLRELLRKREDEVLSDVETTELEDLLARRERGLREGETGPGPGDAEAAPPR